MTTTVAVLFTPADFAALSPRELAGATCVVFDILRATSTMITALAHGAEAVIPVASIADALAVRARHPEVLLGGERNGVKIGAEQTGGAAFDLGNSPREYTPERVRGRTLASTTTNGTRAFRACAGAERVLAGSFLNLTATARWLARHPAPRLWLVCAGTGEAAAWEDVLAAGALWRALAETGGAFEVADSAHLARVVYEQAQADLAGSLQCSHNARRLLALPELQEDVPFCLGRDRFGLVAALDGEGALRIVDP